MQLLHSAKATLPDTASLREFMRLIGTAIASLKTSSAAELLQLSIEQRRDRKKQQRLSHAATAFPNTPAKAIHEICKQSVVKGPVTVELKGPQSIMYLTPQEVARASREGGDWMGRCVYRTADGVNKCDMKMTAELVQAMCAPLNEPVPPDVLSAPASKEVLVTMRCAVFDDNSAAHKVQHKCGSTADTPASMRIAAPAAKQQQQLAEHQATTAEMLHQAGSSSCNALSKPSALVVQSQMHHSGGDSLKQLNAAAVEQTCSVSCKQPCLAAAQGPMQSNATSRTGGPSRESVQLPCKLDARLLDELKWQWDQAVERTKQAELRMCKAEVDMNQHKCVAGNAAVGLGHLHVARQQLLQAQRDEKQAEIVLQAASLRIIAAEPAGSISEEIRIAQALSQEDGGWNDAIQDYRMAALDAVMTRLENSRPFPAAAVAL